MLSHKHSSVVQILGQLFSSFPIYLLVLICKCNSFIFTIEIIYFAYSKTSRNNYLFIFFLCFLYIFLFSPPPIFHKKHLVTRPLPSNSLCSKRLLVLLFLISLIFFLSSIQSKTPFSSFSTPKNSRLLFVPGT